MKRFVTLLGMCAIMASTMATADIAWDGGASYDDCWSADTNWDGDVKPGVNDDAVVNTIGGGWPDLCQDETIDDFTMGGIAELDLNSYLLTVDAFAVSGNSSVEVEDTAGGGEIDATSLTLTANNVASEDSDLLLSSGTLDVANTVTLNASASHDADAMLVVSDDATLSTTYMGLNGEGLATGHAVLDIDEDVTVDSTTNVEGYTYITIAAGVTFDAGCLVQQPGSTLSITGAAGATLMMDAYANFNNQQTLVATNVILERY